MSRERERYDEIGKKIKRESDAAMAALVAQQGGGGGGGGGRRQMQLGTPGVLNTITPCAACKLLRRRCAQECPFSPYFSPHEPHKFASVHKVFGASNVSKLLMEVPENQRADAANSLVYEANVRLRDPVYGCMGAISALQQQLQVLQAELNAIRTEILKFKFRDINNNNNNNNNNINVSNITANDNNTNNSNNSNNNNNNNNNNAATSHVSFFSTTPGVVTLATQSSPPPPPPAPPLRDPQNSSVSSSLYTQQQRQRQRQPSGGSNDYSSISNENISYFG